jgi:hypothetical protein
MQVGKQQGVDAMYEARPAEQVAVAKKLQEQEALVREEKQVGGRGRRGREERSGGGKV